jgi:hypothetical protein
MGVGGGGGGEGRGWEGSGGEGGYDPMFAEAAGREAGARCRDRPGSSLMASRDASTTELVALGLNVLRQRGRGREGGRDRGRGREGGRDRGRGREGGIGAGEQADTPVIELDVRHLQHPVTRSLRQAWRVLISARASYTRINGAARLKRGVGCLKPNFLDAKSSRHHVQRTRSFGKLCGVRGGDFDMPAWIRVGRLLLLPPLLLPPLTLPPLTLPPLTLPPLLLLLLVRVLDVNKSAKGLWP